MGENIFQQLIPIDRQNLPSIKTLLTNLASTPTALGRGRWTIMRINGLQNQTIQDLKKRSRVKSGEDGDSFTISDMETAPKSRTAGPATPVTAMDLLLAAQEQGSEISEEKQAISHGSDVLDQLESLKIGHLNGRINRQQVDHLKKLLAGAPNFPQEPRLLEVLDQITLRARVELAKLGHFSD